MTPASSLLPVVFHILMLTNATLPTLGNYMNSVFGLDFLLIVLPARGHNKEHLRLALLSISLK